MRLRIFDEIPEFHTNPKFLRQNGTDRTKVDTQFVSLAHFDSSTSQKPCGVPTSIGISTVSINSHIDSNHPMVWK